MSAVGSEIPDLDLIASCTYAHHSRVHLQNVLNTCEDMVDMLAQTKVIISDNKEFLTDPGLDGDDEIAPSFR